MLNKTLNLILAKAKEQEMNTLARQSNSKTLKKACAAAVLLVTCLNAHAMDSNVEELLSDLKNEAITSIHAEIDTQSSLDKSYQDLSTALETHVVEDSTENLEQEKYYSMVDNAFDFEASLGSLEFNLEDDVSRELAFTALRLAMDSLENAKVKVTFSNNFSL